MASHSSRKVCKPSESAPAFTMRNEVSGASARRLKTEDSPRIDRTRRKKGFISSFGHRFSYWLKNRQNVMTRGPRARNLGDEQIYRKRCRIPTNIIGAENARNFTEAKEGNEEKPESKGINSFS